MRQAGIYSTLFQEVLRTSELMKDAAKEKI
jgi:hypothetical protein